METQQEEIKSFSGVIRAEPIIQFFKALEKFVTEAKIKATSEGFEVICMDPANVQMTIAKLRKSAFIEYECSNEIGFAVNLETICDILKTAKKGFVTISNEDTKLNISIKKDGRIESHKISLIDIDEREQKVPELQFTGYTIVLYKTWKDILDKASAVAKSILLETQGTNLKIEAKSDLNNYTTTIPMAEGSFKSKYNIDYLINMVKAIDSKMISQFIIRSANDFPMMLEAECPDVSIKYILAPRIEE